MGALGDLFGTLEGKLFCLAVIFFLAFFWAMGQNWKDSNIDSLKTVVLLVVGALAGAFGKGKGIGDAQTGPPGPPGPTGSGGNK
jgi:hypothetical protein